MSKKILIIDAHPDRKSFSFCLAEEYFLSAQEKGYDTKILKLRDLKFDPILHNGRRKNQKLEKDLVKAQKLISWCNHLVIVTPVWWHSIPALLKGFIERAFTQGFAFDFSETYKPEKLLTGKSARIIYTHGAPKWVYRLFYGDIFWKQIKGIFKFCGFCPVKRTYTGNIHGIKGLLKRQYFLKQIKHLGLKGK